MLPFSALIRLSVAFLPQLRALEETTVHDQAFDAASLTAAAHVLSTENRGPMICTPLRWKESMLKVPVFRGFDGSRLSPDKPMPYDKLRDDMGRQSLDAGFEERWTPRFARRGAANSTNGNASDAVRDQMMRYDPRFTTFKLSLAFILRPPRRNS